MINNADCIPTSKTARHLLMSSSTKPATPRQNNPIATSHLFIWCFLPSYDLKNMLVWIVAFHDFGTNVKFMIESFVWGWRVFGQHQNRFSVFIISPNRYYASFRHTYTPRPIQPLGTITCAPSPLGLTTRSIALSKSTCIVFSILISMVFNIHINTFKVFHNNLISNL